MNANEHGCCLVNQREPGCHAPTCALRVEDAPDERVRQLEADLANMTAAWRSAVAANDALTEFVAESRRRAAQLQQAATDIERDAERVRALEEENSALRGAINYAMTKRGSAFDFDEWDRLAEAAMKGSTAPSALENEQAINAGLRHAIELGRKAKP